jgi:hypothetical protein
MSEFKRKVNDPLFLKLKIEPKDDSYFVRAELTDQGDNPVAGSPVTLTSQGGGLYADDGSVLMPNVAELRANYFVYYDAGFTRAACEHGGFDVFERDDLDIASFFPRGAKVLGQVKGASRVAQAVSGASKIKKTVASTSRVEAGVSSSKIGKKVNTTSQVEGVVNE